MSLLSINRNADKFRCDLHEDKVVMVNVAKKQHCLFPNHVLVGANLTDR